MGSLQRRSFTLPANLMYEGDIQLTTVEIFRLRGDVKACDFSHMVLVYSSGDGTQTQVELQRQDEGFKPFTEWLLGHWETRVPRQYNWLAFYLRKVLYEKKED